ncbi:MAG: cytochrome c biogenesis protein CcsA [Bacteroidetes bacterium]|nr:cytochrome c biogenesis protein CcsA [Bacteroidota bacterium]
MGSFFITSGFIFAFIAMLSFLFVSRGNERLLKPARLFFHLAVIMVLSSAAFLLYLIITHQFQYTYVWNYSSKDLPINLLISTFYAGQEGSFHLWALLTAVLGIFLHSYIIKRDSDPGKLENGHRDRYEPLVMFNYSLILSFLIFIMIIKSPYMLVWESFPKDVEFGFIPPDGRGLNPLLQNFWMTIHPPILFTGFSSLAIPFCFAITALIKNRYDRWMKLALPWTLFSGMILGVGIMLGGFWAYGVLGWGGYWGWDPVENSSLVPWIVIVAGIHTMVGEEKTGKYKKTSLLLCIMAFVLVLYSTFLTRSGLLGDASVHSFVDPGQEVYLFLIVFLSLFSAGGIGLILFRLKSLRSLYKSSNIELSRESALIIGAITLCATALVVLVGTSWPIITKATVDPAFYNKMNLPLAILIALINGVSILLAWKHTDEKKFLKSLYLPLILTGVFTIGLVLIGIDDVLMGVFAASALFSFFINLNIVFKILNRSTVKAGPYIAHLGIMILFLGIIGSSKYSVEENVSLPLGETKEALGYSLTYKGASLIPDTKDKYHFNVVVEKDGKGYLLQPIMYYSDYSQGIMKNPDIANLVTKDIYLEPVSLETPQPFSESDIINLTKGSEKEFNGLKIKFDDFDQSKFNQESMMKGEENTLGAKLEVTVDGKKEDVIVEQFFSNGQTQNIPVQLTSNIDYTLYLTHISIAGESSVDVAVVKGHDHGSQSAETLVLTASVKPFINLVWGGTIIMALGFFASLLSRYRRFKTTDKKAVKENSSDNHTHSKNGHKKVHAGQHN